MSKLKVLSLFDGCAGARQALDSLGIECEYYASEVDTHAIKVAMANYPDITQLGDITKLDETNLPKDITLLVGGSPCQSLSTAAGSSLSGLDHGKSTLFWEYIRILNLVKPKYFLLENVASMKNSDRDRISEIMGVEPVMINSSLLTAQSRKRYYWINIPNVTQPEDLGLVLKDILDPEADDITEKIFTTKPGSCARDKSLSNLRTIFEKSKTLTAAGQGGANSGATNVITGDKQLIKSYKDLICIVASESSVSLRSMDGSIMQDVDKCIRRLTVTECEKLQGMEPEYTNVAGVSKTQRYRMIGNGFTIPVVAWILKGIK